MRQLPVISYNQLRAKIGGCIGFKEFTSSRQNMSIGSGSPILRHTKLLGIAY